MIHNKIWRIVLSVFGKHVPQLIETCAQGARGGIARARARGHGNIETGNYVLIQAKRFPGNSFDAVAGNGATECLGGDGQTEARLCFMIG
jgi:hypothetical protein